MPEAVPSASTSPPKAGGGAEGRVVPAYGGPHLRLEHPRLFGVARAVLEERHLAGEVRPVGLQLVEVEQLRADRHQVEAPVLVGLDLRQLRHAAHLVQRPHPVRPDLAALADADDAEPLRLLGEGQQVAHELPVALLEDVEGQHQPGEQDGAEREEGEHAPDGNLEPC